MARRVRRLGVWLEGVHVADFEQRHWNELKLRYTDEALSLWPRNSPVISCSLPLRAGPQDAKVFGSGLLPEGHALEALASRAGVATRETFGLLERYGRDVAGALVVAAEEWTPGAGRVEPYTPEALEAAIDDLADHPLGVADDSELSLAGLQDKLLLVALPSGGWGRPVHGEPSTHILKVDDRRRPGLVAAEAAALRLAEHAGLTAIDPVLERIGDVDCLIVRRFDRRESGGAVQRIHQEDLSQATGIDHLGPTGRGKYERFGGPGLRAAARLLDLYAADVEAQLDRLVATAAFTVAIGNADAHAKNLALLHPTGQTVELAPLYDTVPTALWPKLRPDLAMRINGRDRAATVTLDDIAAEAKTWPHSPQRARAVAAETVQVLLEGLGAGIIDEGSPVGVYVRERCQTLLAGR